VQKAALGLLLSAAIVVSGGGSALAQGPAPDCVGPAGDPQPGTQAWQQRELENAYCGEQRAYDTSANPLFASAGLEMTARHGRDFRADPFRDPLVLNGSRFRYQEVTVPSPDGGTVPGMLFRPCDASCTDRPAGLGSFDPPYPGVVIVHGGAANQEMYLWGAEGLAEAGYMVLTFQVPDEDNLAGDAHYGYTKSALDWFLSASNPGLGELDQDHIGLAGHSAGGVAVSRLGQEDPRIDAIVSWDRAQSGPMPDDLRMRTPALFLIADYLCQKVPVCVPQPYQSPPDPLGPGNKGQDFQRVSGAGIDSMQVALRAATHLDFTQFPPAGTGSRYGAAVAFYYTLAWFDRYLKGGEPGGHAQAADARDRLTATRFDDSGDIHNISGGTFDPATQENVPAYIGGQPVADRLSFEFRSAYFLDGGREECADVRAGCSAPARGSPPGGEPQGQPAVGGAPAQSHRKASKCRHKRAKRGCRKKR
jgi:dienelactone hydrolase